MPTPDYTKERKPMYASIRAKLKQCEGYDDDGNERDLFHGLREIEADLAKLRQHVEDFGQ